MLDVTFYFRRTRHNAQARGLYSYAIYCNDYYVNINLVVQLHPKKVIGHTHTRTHIQTTN